MKATATRHTPLLLFLLAASSHARAGEMELFGMTLGAPFQVQECPKKSVGGLTIYDDSAATCFERLGSQEQLRATTAIASDAVMIRFPPSEAPAVMSGGAAIGLVIDGNLEGCTFNTRGVDAQAQVLDVLKQNFGEPVAYARKQAQNGLGETFESFDATWTKPEADVLFRSVTARVDQGLVNVYTAKARQVRPRPAEPRAVAPRPAAAPAKTGS